MDKIILIGAGGHARSCIDVIQSNNHYEIGGLIEKDDGLIDHNLGYPVIGTDDDLEKLRQKYSHALVTVGQLNSSKIRIKLYELLSDLNFVLPVIISSKAYVSKTAKIGKGTIVMHGAIVNANALIGANCILNNKALIEHDAVIGDHCHISTGAIINGEVTVGNESFIGSGAVTKQTISIGRNCVIGAGSVIKSDIQSNQIIKN